MVDVLRRKGGPLPCDQVVPVFYQTLKAVQHMHKQKPPIVHRDLKVNICTVITLYCHFIMWYSLLGSYMSM